MAELYFDTLSDNHAEHVSGFDCGDMPWEIDLNDFIQNDALRDQRRNLSRTYLFFADEDGQKCVGFATLLATAVERKQWHLLPKLRKDEIEYKFIPALLIGRLAVRNSVQGQRIGSRILAWVRDLATDLKIGCRMLALHVDKANERGIKFYQREGFVAAPVKPSKGLQTMLYDLMVQEDAAK